MVNYALFVAWWCLGASGAWGADLASPAPEVAAVGALDISQGWRFRTDPKRVGIRKRWDGISLDDSPWTLTDTGGPWEERGAPGYDGVGWYRKWVELSEPWPRVFLVLPGVADRVDLFVNGGRVARNLARPHPGTRFIVREITTRIKGRTRFLIALRMTNDKKNQPGGFHNTGGLPVMLARRARPLLPNQAAWLDYLARQYPTLPWPAWMRNGGAAWITLGEPGSGGGGIIGPHGQLAPVGQEFAVSCWLYDSHTKKKFYAPEALPCVMRLEGRVLPLPEMDTRAGQFNLKVRYWSHVLSKADGVTLGIGEVTVQNRTDRTRKVDLIVAVHPFGPQRQVFRVERVSYVRETQTILVNGLPAVILSEVPSGFGAAPFAEPGTVARFLAKGELPPEQETVDLEQKLASGAAVYKLKIQPYGARTQTFRVFLTGRPKQMTPELSRQVRKVDRKASLKNIKRTWQSLLGGKEKLRLRFRDKTIQDAYYASLAHLYVTLGGMGLAPSVDGQFVPRASAVAVSALLRAGHTDTARRCLSPFLRAWPPEDVTVKEDLEPDAPGLAIHAFMEYVRFTRDRAFLAEAYPVIERACRALQRLRYRHAVSGGDALPASRRRTDTGEGDEVWASAWGVVGWRDAEEAARLLGREDDAAWMRGQGLRLKAELERVYAKRNRPAGSQLPPGGPVLLWPCAALSAEAPDVRSGFERVWEAWFAGSGGGCRPGEQYLPSAGLSYAHNWLLLNDAERAQQVLAWHLKHQTMPGTYAWAQAVDPLTMRHGGGGLPDPRAAAEYICLVRDMLLREDHNALLLTPGLAARWAKPGRHIEIKQAPTWFGTFPGYSVVSSPRGITLRLMRGQGSGESYQPPGGIRWRVPGRQPIRQLTVGRRRIKEIPPNRWIHLPPGVRQVGVVW